MKTKTVKINKRLEYAWLDAQPCHCLQKGCNFEDHKECPVCTKPMVYQDYEGFEGKELTPNSWTIEYIKPLEFGGSKKRANRRAVHVSCKGKMDKVQNNINKII